MQYLQGQFAAVNHHRLSGGFGIRDLRPALDLDIAAGGMFEASQSFASTTASVESF
ncbi:MAG: hypothetical protein MK108_00570 [Mariniblastus sp.]|nr:hypothetical protein [Mariniblastus sp.]